MTWSATLLRGADDLAVKPFEPVTSSDTQQARGQSIPPISPSVRCYAAKYPASNTPTYPTYGKSSSWCRVSGR